ncbi:MAG: SUMF1/EgtB/PvdO family nonheme iron enzyme [Thermodesulfobacteriota bacterium]|nr:SUMF1/EgtB/PvdO family nonheme iron enzyme [Thermodesulfobacteriota bacterium]
MKGMDLFVDIYPIPHQREICIDHATMEKAVVRVNLDPYAIGKYPVTNGQYHQFIQETGYFPKDPYEYSHELFLAHWEKSATPPKYTTDHPVTFVSYDDALAYAEYMGGRLPTVLEWLYAAFATTGSKYPWGEVFSTDRCNVNESNQMGTTPVGLYSPDGDSPTGCCDMMGNVWEWTSTPFSHDENSFMAMGTGWDHYSSQTEIPLDRAYRNHSVGFRVARDLPVTPAPGIRTEGVPGPFNP